MKISIKVIPIHIEHLFHKIAPEDELLDINLYALGLNLYELGNAIL